MKTIKRELEERYNFYNNRALIEAEEARRKEPKTLAYARAQAGAAYNRGRADAIGEVMEMIGLEVPDDF